MKLDIYKGKEAIKRYEADVADISFAVMEDVANAVDLDSLQSSDDKAIMGAVIKFVMKSTGTVKELLKEIFDGITDEDIRGAHIVDICEVFVDVARYTISELTRRLTGKNLHRE